MSSRRIFVPAVVSSPREQQCDQVAGGQRGKPWENIPSNQSAHPIVSAGYKFYADHCAVHSLPLATAWMRKNCSKTSGINLSKYVGF